MKRIVVISDLHSGHQSGLTPPEWQREYKKRDKFQRVRQVLWDFYAEKLEALQPIDRLVVNGDAIDGKGERSGGTELIEADRNIQAAIAADCIKYAKAKAVNLISGTPYHTGRDDDFEYTVASLCHADHYAAHEWVDCEGVIFDFKHKTNGSVIPHGRYTGPQRAALWNLIWAERGIQPLARIIVRSHVHFFGYSGDARKMVITTPALQAWTKFGSKECEGTNDIGLVSIDCEGGEYEWHAHMLDMKWAAAKPIRA
ncbi:hypothetical protein M0R72_18570 [Candidatus Pacearchaeota archaeon]|jgi:hypothetical protein|nr:hypothetical protein [Candidatus Pacearchaeota archaeon]